MLPNETVVVVPVFAPKLLKFTALMKSLPAGPVLPFVELKLTHPDPLLP